MQQAMMTPGAQPRSGRGCGSLARVGEQLPDQVLAYGGSLRSLHVLQNLLQFPAVPRILLRPSPP